MKAPAFTVVPLPDELSFTTGAAISCGTGTAYGALRRIRLSGNDTIAIFGQGPVGLSATQLAAAMGARVIALDVSERAARSRQGFRARPRPSTLSRAPTIPWVLIKDLDPRLRRRVYPRHARRSPKVAIAAVRATKVWGNDLLCRRAQPGDDRRQPRHAAQTADHRRVVDLLVDRPGGMRSLRGGPRHRCRGPLHPPLAARPWPTKPTNCSTRKTTGKGVFLIN